MWTVVYIAPNKKIADSLKDILTNEGLLVQLRAIGLPNSGESGAFEILVPESEVDEAFEIVNTRAR